jgi:hypothetical protein
MLKIAPPAKATRIETAFVLPANLIHAKKATIRAQDKKRAGIKRLIRPENARSVLANLPVEPDDRTHCILRGDFVFCDLLALLLTERLAAKVRVSTLSMSLANARTLASLITTGRASAVSLLISHSFTEIEKEAMWPEVMKILRPHVKVTLARIHTKTICCEMLDGSRYVFEGSANLRSSDTVENLCIVNDPATHDFHARWMDELEARPPMEIAPEKFTAW